MTGNKGVQMSTADRRAKIPALWAQGLTAQEIADRFGVSLYTAQGDIADLQARGTIAKRHHPRPQLNRVTHPPGRPKTKSVAATVRAADKVRSAAAYAAEVANFARAKRVVTIAQSNGELRIVKFFSDCGEAVGVSRDAITGVCPGVVTGDIVFMGSGGGENQKWSVWQELEARAA